MLAAIPFVTLKDGEKADDSNNMSGAVPTDRRRLRRSRARPHPRAYQKARAAILAARFPSGSGAATMASLSHTRRSKKRSGKSCRYGRRERLCGLSLRLCRRRRRSSEQCGRLMFALARWPDHMPRRLGPLALATADSGSRGRYVRVLLTAPSPSAGGGSLHLGGSPGPRDSRQRGYGCCPAANISWR